MAAPINIIEDFVGFCRKLEFDLHLDDYKGQLIDYQKLNDIIVFPNQFFFIDDYTTAKNIYVHSNVTEITGYQPEEFTRFGRIYYLIHPDDRNFVFEFSKRTISLTSLYKKELKAKPFSSLFSIDFRLKHNDGHYLRMNRQGICFKTDNEGNMVLSLLLFTDISNLKRSESYNIFWLGDPKYQFHYEDLFKKYRIDYLLTNREREILLLLAEGKNSSQIAERLCVSVHTVISHRKHLLHKTGTRNSAALINFAIGKGII